jgi:hypothetical protein
MLGQCAIPLHPATQGTREASETICQRVILLTFLPVFPFGNGRHMLRSTKRGCMHVVVVFRTQWYHDRASAQGTMVPHYITLPSPDVVCMDFKDLSFIA